MLLEAINYFMEMGRLHLLYNSSASYYAKCQEHGKYF